MKNEKGDVSPKNQEKKPKKKKKRKIAEVFRLHQKGISVKEIAEKMSVSVKTVEALMGKALKIFRHNLKEYY